MNTKLIVTNSSALSAKYGGGAAAVHAAIQQLIAADAARGVESRVADLNASGAKQNKDAIDALCHPHPPDYLLLLGAYDVIPSQMLKNPLYEPKNPDTDTDVSIPSDLPYASEAPFSDKPEDFTGATRVVGRLPDLMGAKEPSYLLDLLGTAAGATARPKSDYLSYLGVSTDSWKGSTRLSLTQIFGEGVTVRLCPAEGPEWTAAQLASRVHYFNCHGGEIDPCFYGEKEGVDDFPVAHDAHFVKGRLREGTVAAMECCYGAQLYDPSSKDADGQMPMGQAYLANKTYGYLGSSTVAYAPADENSSADFVCQFFLKHVLAGASLGRALLEARQEFVKASDSPLGPIDLKTIAQFLLLGDPSVHPVVPEEEAFGFDFSDRLERRRQLFERGLEIARTLAVVASARVAVRSAAVETRLREVAATAGIRVASLLSFAGVHLVFGAGGRRVLEVRVAGDEVSGVRELRRHG